MSDHKEIDEATGTDTTGHEWDGIKELNTPLPRWWLWTFYGCIIWSLAYMVAYPAWPMLTEATAGMLGYSSRGEVAAEIDRFRSMNAPLDEGLVNAELTEIAAHPELGPYAINGGAAVFRTYCAQCHGSGAAGAKGYPNLLDDDWLWGGDVEAIRTTIAHGIRNTQDEDARLSEMPAFADQLSDEEIGGVVQHVLSLSGAEHDAALAEAGAEVYADNCAACHGDGGEGNVDLGAPNLSDAIWLYGGAPEVIEETVRYSRAGVMPPWAGRLTEAQIRQVAVYVHGLGGGE